MTRSKKIKDKIADLEYWLTKLKFVQEKFPGYSARFLFSGNFLFPASKSTIY